MSVPVLDRNAVSQGVPARSLSLPSYSAVTVKPAAMVPALDRNCLTLTSAMVDRTLNVAPVDCCVCETDTNDTAAAVSFETVSKNLDAVGAVFGYTGDDLTSITYASGVIKSLTYGADGLASVTLSGAVPDGIATVKTFTYTGGSLTAVSYS